MTKQNDSDTLDEYISGCVFFFVLVFWPPTQLSTQEKNKPNWKWTKTINSKLSQKKRYSSVMMTEPGETSAAVGYEQLGDVATLCTQTKMWKQTRGFYRWLGRRWSADTGSFFSCRCRRRSWHGPEWTAFGSGRGGPRPGGSSAAKTSHLTSQLHINYLPTQKQHWVFSYFHSRVKIQKHQLVYIVVGISPWKVIELSLAALFIR